MRNNGHGIGGKKKTGDQVSFNFSPAAKIFAFSHSTNIHMYIFYAGTLGTSPQNPNCSTRFVYVFVVSD